MPNHLCLYSVAIVALLLATASAQPLGDIIRTSVDHYNGSVVILQGQLQLLLDLSTQLLRDYDTAPMKLLNDLTIARTSVSPIELLEAANSAFGSVQRAAPEDTILAILTRRALLACIVLRWTADEEADSGRTTENLLAELTTKMYKTHVEAAVRKGILDYLHISKCGGSSFSNAAYFSKCKKEKGLGQPRELGDTGRWINYTAFSSWAGPLRIEWARYEMVDRGGQVHGCKERHNWLVQQGFQYTSNEYTLFGGMTGMKGVHVCTQGVNMVTLRDPDGRLDSHMHFMLGVIKTRFEQQLGQRGRQMFYDLFCTSNRTVWQTSMPAVIDNYIIRSFVGEKGFHAPFAGIGEEHLEVARNMLLQFDLVMDLDAGPEGIDLTMQQGLGWRTTLAEVHANTLEFKAEQLNYDKASCMNEQLVLELQRLQEPDRHLYRLGRAVGFLDRLMLSMSQAIGLEPTRTEGGPNVLDKSAKDVTCGLFGGARLAGRRSRRLTL